MRSPIRAGIVSGVTAALLVGLLGLVPAPGVAQSSRVSEHDRALAVLSAVESAFTPPRTRAESRSGARQTPLPRREDLGLLLHRLRALRADLTVSERSTADQYLTRPAALAASSSSCTGSLFGKVIASAHFCVRYSNSTNAQAQLTSDTLEHVYAEEVGRLGYRAPLDDGDGRLDVTLSELGNQGIYGYCSTTTGNAQSPAYCELDNDFSAAEYGAAPIDSLRVTAAHEFFHAIQFAYNADQAVWAMEGTAVWAEDELYPQINDYLQYLRYSPIREPGTPIDSNGTFERYGIVVFWKFLSEYLHDPGVIRQVWQYADYPTGRTALRAVVAMLAAHGLTFGPTFARFASWNTLPAGSYRDRALYPGPIWARVLTLRPGAPASGPLISTLDHLSSAAYLIRPAKTLRHRLRLRLRVFGPPRATMPQALVQLRLRTGAIQYLSVPLNRSGDGARVVSFNPRKVRSVVVTLSNASLYQDDGSRFALRARVIR